jgi:predicted O-methyltransferase YrrM
VPMPLPMPRPGTWAASEDLLLWLAGYVLERKPKLVVDLGSGQSSVWMAGAMRTAGYDGRVIGVDHDEQYAEATRELARRQGVEPWLSVLHAPLLAQHVEGRDVTWYDLSVLSGLSSIDLLCIDGPPGQGVAQARWAALPALRDRLSARPTIVLDDMIRRDEQEIADDWLGRYPEFGVERLDFEKGAAIMTLKGD